MISRMIRATQADVSLYEEAEANPSLQTEAITIVAIVQGISAILGIVLSATIGGEGAGSGVTGAILGFIFGMIGFFVGSYIAFFVGTNLFGGTADYGEVLRTLGYAQSPLVLSFIPCLGLIAILWSLWLAIVAMRAAFDFDTTKAVLTAIVLFIINIVIALIVGGGAAAVGTLVGGS